VINARNVRVAGLRHEEGENIALFTACSTAFLIFAETSWP